MIHLFRLTKKTYLWQPLIGPASACYCFTGRTYISAKSQVRTHSEQKYGKILSKFCTKCVRTMFISLNPILTVFVMMLVSSPHRHPLMIYHQLTQSE